MWKGSICPKFGRPQCEAVGNSLGTPSFVFADIPGIETAAASSVICKMEITVSFRLAIYHVCLLVGRS